MVQDSTERRRVWLRLSLALTAIVVALSIEVGSGSSADTATLWGLSGPECVWRRLTDGPCPGCGLTRSTACIAQGRLRDGWAYNPAGFLVVAILGVTVVAQGLTLRSRCPRCQHLERTARWALASGALLVWLSRSDSILS